MKKNTFNNHITGCGGEIYYLDSYNYNQLGESSYETKQLESPELEELQLNM